MPNTSLRQKTGKHLKRFILKKKKKKGFFWILPIIVLLGSLIYIVQLDRNENKKIVTHKSSVAKKLSKNKQSLASENLNTTSNFIEQESNISSNNTISNT